MRGEESVSVGWGCRNEGVGEREVNIKALLLGIRKHSSGEHTQRDISRTSHFTAVVYGE